MSVDIVRLQPFVRDAMNVAIDYFALATGGRWVPGRGVVGGMRPTITSGYRDLEKQAALYAARASNPYPVNRPGDSAHNYGLAFDSSFAAREKPLYMPLWTKIREAVGFRVPPNDLVHAEYPWWRQLVGQRFPTQQ